MYTAFLVVRYTGHCFRQSRTCIIITRLVLFICCHQMSLCVGGDETTRTVGGGVDRGWGGPQMLAKFVFFPPRRDICFWSTVSHLPKHRAPYKNMGGIVVLGLWRAPVIGVAKLGGFV